MLTSSAIYWHHYFLCNKEMSQNLKNQQKVNFEGENLYIFWTTWRISMKFSGRMWLMIMLKVTKNQGFTLPLESTVLEKSLSAFWGLPIFAKFNWC